MRTTLAAVASVIDSKGVSMFRSVESELMQQINPQSSTVADTENLLAERLSRRRVPISHAK